MAIPGIKRTSKRHKAEPGLSFQAIQFARWIFLRRYSSGKRQPHMDYCFHVGLWPEHPAEQYRFVDRMENEMSERVFMDEPEPTFGPRVDAIMRAVNEALYV